MSDLALLGVRFETQGGVETNKQLDDYAAKAPRAEKATDAFSAAQKRVGGATAQMLANIERAVVELADLARAQGVAGSAAAAFVKQQQAVGAASAKMGAGIRLGSKDMDAHVQAFRALQGAQEGVVKMSGRTQSGLLNLSRQLSDVGVTAAMGMNPLMILIQQGPQIADALGEVKAGGMGVAAAFKQVAVGVWAALAPFLPFLAAATAVAAVLGGGFLLGARNAHAATGDLTKGLGLTADQLEKVKQKSVTFGDTFMAMITVIGRHLMKGPIGDGLKWIGDAWDKLMDGITRRAINGTSAIVAAFVASGKAMKGQNFGEAYKESYGATQKGLNGFFGEITSEAAARRTKEIKKEAGKAPKGAADPRDQTDERTAQIAQALASAQQDELQARLGLTKDVMARAGIEKQIAAAALVEKQAGVDKQIASLADDKGLSAAKKAELSGQLQVAKAMNARAAALKDELTNREADEAISNQIIAQRENIAGSYDQIATITAAMAGNAAEQNAIEAKGLANRQRVETLNQAERLQQLVTNRSITQSDADAQRAATADLQTAQRLQQDRAAQLRIQQDFTAQLSAQLGSQRDLLSTQAALAQSALARHNIERQILDIDQKLRRAKIEELALAGDKGALSDLLGLSDREKNEKLALAQNELMDAYNEAAGSLTGMSGALKAGDWTGFASSLKTFTSLLQSLKGASTTSKLGAVGGVAQAVGGAIGGKGGGLIAGAGMGAVAGVAIGGAAVSMGLMTAAALAGPVGWAIAGVAALGGAILGLVGSSKKAKAAAEEQRKAEADRQLQVAKQRDDLNINILTLEGKATEALTAKRASEATQIDATNRGLADRLNELQDAHDLENMHLRLLQAQGKASEALILTRKQETDATTDALKPLLAQVYAAEDLAKAAQDAADAQANATAVFNEGRTLEQRRLELMGDMTGAKRLARDAELEGYSEANKGLALFVFALEDYKTAQDAATEAAKTAAETAKAVGDAQRDVWSNAYQGAVQGVADARSNLLSAYNDEKGAIEGRIGDLNSLIKTLGDFRKSLDFGDLSGQSATSRYGSMKGEFERIAANDNGQIATFGPEFLAVSKATARTALDYARDVAMVKRATEAALEKATTQVDVEHASLKALNDSVAGLGIINSSVLSVRDAIAALAGATATASAAGSRMDPQWGATANMGVNQQLASATGYTGAFGGGGFQSFITSDAGAAFRDVAKQILTAGGEANRIQGFATGGSGVVAGSGGPDSQLVSMRLTPGELINVSHGDGGMSGIEERLDAILVEVRGARGNGSRIARAMDALYDLIRGFTKDGTSLTTREAA